MQIKLIIWDFAERHLQSRRAELARGFDGRGVVSLICTEVERATVEVRLEALGLRDVFGYVPLGSASRAQAVATIVEAMQIHPANVLLVDHHSAVLEEARAQLPDLHVLDASAPDCEPILEALLAVQRPLRAAGRHDVRIMYGSQSEDIAHFSAMRGRLDYDSAPRVFSLRTMIAGPLAGERFAPALVYGAGIDYSNPRWPDLADLLDDQGLFEVCAHLLCERVLAEGSRMLVVLPPEDAPESCYRPHMGQTRKRTIMFNGLWRAAVAHHAKIETLDLTGIVEPQDLKDIALFDAGFLRPFAGIVDRWIGGAQWVAAKAA